MTTRSPHPSLDKEDAKIRRLFDGIARRYDFLNHLLSLNLDRRWRRQAVRGLRPRGGGVYLDACAGTGDLAFEIDRQLGATALVLASDFSLPMLRGGTKKRNGRRVSFLAADTTRLPFEEMSFSGATVGFGIRNVENLEQGLGELRRILCPEGQLVILEFTRVENRLVRPIFDLYCQHLLPRIGNWISGSKERAYTYLQESIAAWPTGDELAACMRGVGFREVRWKRCFPGNVALHVGSR